MPKIVARFSALAPATAAKAVSFICALRHDLKSCVRTVPSLKGPGFFSHFTQHSAFPPQFAQKRRELGAPVSAACWAILFRAYGAGVFGFLLHYQKRKLVLTHALQVVPYYKAFFNDALTSPHRFVRRPGI